MHQPWGEIVPSTTLQADGGWNCLQFSQRWSPFGVSWYFTFFCGVLACARATLNPATDAPAAPAAIVRTRRRETPCCSVMTFHPEMRISRKHGPAFYTGQGVRLGPCPSHGPALNRLTWPNRTRTAFAGFVPCFFSHPAILMNGETLPPRVVRSDGYLQADTKHCVRAEGH